MTSSEHPTPADEAAAAGIMGLLAVTHLTPAGELADAVARHAAPLGAQDVVLYLVDYEQSALVPVPSATSAGQGVLRVDGTVGGRTYTSSTVHDLESSIPGRRRVWLPLLDGTERLGVMELTLPDSGGLADPALVRQCERYAHLIAQLVVSKGAYSDVFELVRRRRSMSIAAEVQYALLPPSTFAGDGVMITGALEPAYDVGGDSFDYAVNGSLAHLAVFDAMGHGLSAAITSTVAVSAYRSSRRQQLDLTGTYAAVNAALLAMFGGDRFTTATLAQLDLRTGTLRWVNAGHPPPLLLRRRRLVKTLRIAPSPPMGMPLESPPPQLGRADLEPGDQVLLYTDGLTEARHPNGSFFTEERLAEFLERQAAAGLAGPETLRRLRHAILDYQERRLQDDATAVLVEWSPSAGQDLLPLAPGSLRESGSPTTP